MARLTTFPLFPRLPQELQNTIWDNFTNKPCHFEAIDHKPKPSTLKEQSLVFVTKTPRIPPLLRTSRAARQSCLKKYLELPTISGKTYFDPEVDIVYFGYGCKNGAAAMKWLAENAHVRYLEIRIIVWPIWCHKWGQPFFHTLHQHGNLKKITLVAEMRDFPETLFEMIKGRFTDDGIGKVPELKYLFRNKAWDVAAGCESRTTKIARKKGNQNVGEQ